MVPIIYLHKVHEVLKNVEKKKKKNLTKYLNFFLNIPGKMRFNNVEDVRLFNQTSFSI